MECVASFGIIGNHSIALLVLRQVAKWGKAHQTPSMLELPEERLLRPWDQGGSGLLDISLIGSTHRAGRGGFRKWLGILDRQVTNNLESMLQAV